MGNDKIFQEFNKNMKNKYSLTVGIPTYYGGQGLVKAAKSVLASKNVGEFDFIVCVDGNPLDKKIEKQLNDLGVRVVFSKARGGQVARIKQMISLAKSDLLILTQDDIRFEPDTLSKIIKNFEVNHTVTMIGARVMPVRAKTYFEKIIEVGVNLTHRVGTLWNSGNNYLLSSGRCLAFRTSFIKKFQIPEEVINSDAYLYFENKKRGGLFRYLPQAVVYNKSPQNLKEHLKQSRKFQYSLEELSKHTDLGLMNEYSVPFVVKLRAYFDEFIENPFWAILYLYVFLYTRTQQKHMYSKAKRFWDTDTSTKAI